MRVVGLDCSSKSIAYSVIEDDALVAYGQIEFEGTDRNYRVKDAYRKAATLFAEHRPNVVAIEDAVFVQNQAALITLAYYFGSIIAASPVPVHSVKPMVWQNSIGNKVLTAAQKLVIERDNPGKSTTWYKTKQRAMRKDFTRQWVKTAYGVEIASDDITDAVAIGWWMTQNGN